MVRQRLARHRREDAMKMKTRKKRHPRQLFQIQRLIQMLLDMLQHPQNALLIIIPRCLMLWPRAAHMHAKLANAIRGRLTNLAVLRADTSFKWIQDCISASKRPRKTETSAGDCRMYSAYDWRSSPT